MGQEATIITNAQWVKNLPTMQETQRCRFVPWSGKIAWRRKCQLTPVLLPEKSHGQRSLANYSPCGSQKLDIMMKQNNGIMDSFKIEKGACQGFILSPCLFNFYVEDIM